MTISVKPFQSKPYILLDFKQLHNLELSSSFYYVK